MAKNTIVLKSYNEPVYEEIPAAATITPGMLIEHISADTVQAHSTAEGNALPMFAVEDDYQGKDIDDDYSADDPVKTWIPQRGEQVYALLADGETVVIGNYLSSNGDGYLRLHDEDSLGSIQTNAIVAQAVEALDLSGSSGAESTQRIEVRIV